MASEYFFSNPMSDPKRAQRFIMRINGIPHWIVKKVSKPSFEIGDIEHKYLNHTFHYPGGLRWNKISLTLVDPVSPDASRTMMDIINNSGYRFPDNPNETTTLSKAGAVMSLGRVAISQIGSLGEIVEEWELINAWISSLKFGELDYSAEEMTNIEMEFTYDYAILKKSGQPVPF